QQATGLAVDADVEEIGAVPPVVATAIYGIVAEAVRNVHRHAGASRCSIVVRREDGLHVTVTDDGRGIAPDATPGVGTRSMRERAEGVGGRVTISAAVSGGTEVRVVVPEAAMISAVGAEA
ncbi:MAG TPA: ATP-binding protein, partial [Acidimicrobiales bacterium]